MLLSQNLLQETPGKYKCLEREKLNHDVAPTEVSEHHTGSFVTGKSYKSIPSGITEWDICISASSIHLLWATP